jgi:LPXTG-site transpeptidase (sortase) family protein
MYKVYSFIIITCISSFLVYNIDHKQEKIVNNIIQEDIVEEEKNTYNDIVEIKEEIINKEVKKEEKELMTLIIPKINFEGKIYNKNSLLNDIDKNIIIMNESDMPDKESGIVIIGGHSGYGKYAYFKNLNKLDINDEIIINYLGNKYIYHVVNFHLDFKDGSISINNNNNNKNKLFLFTCNPNDKNNYLVYDCERK